MKASMVGDNLALHGQDEDHAKVTIEKSGAQYAIKFSDGTYLGGPDTITSYDRPSSSAAPVYFDIEYSGDSGYFLIKSGTYALQHTLLGNYGGNYYLKWKDGGGSTYGLWRASDTLDWGDQKS